SSLVSWLQGDSYYSLVSSAQTQDNSGEFIFARLGANDPDFNLRSEPAFILRQKGQNHVFANALETHGYFNESIEASVGARGLVERIEVLGHDDVATVVRVSLTTGKQYHFGISNQTGGAQDGAHKVSFGGEVFQWTGPYAQL
ncbi:MAG: chondroitin lyase, partial [Vibrio sp.]